MTPTDPVKLPQGSGVGASLREASPFIHGEEEVRAGVYHYYDGKVSFFDLKGEKHIVKKEDFMDITSKGGRFHQFYTYLVKTDLDTCLEMEGEPIERID